MQSQESSAVYGTDYTKWGMWCPEDEEDDLFNSLTPNQPAFQAMEKDINERHKRCAKRQSVICMADLCVYCVKYSGGERPAESPVQGPACWEWECCWCCTP